MLIPCHFNTNHLICFTCRDHAIISIQFIIVPAENKQDMLHTSITLLWSAISSVGFLLVDTCRSWVSRCDRFGPERGYLQKGLWSSSQQNL